MDEAGDHEKKTRERIVTDRAGVSPHVKARKTSESDREDPLTT